MLHGYQHIASNIKNIENNLKKGIAFVPTDESILASIDLINNYQDKNNYNAILLDEEKKLIARQLLYQVKLSLNNEIVLYDKNDELIAFIIKDSNGYLLNFLSYEDGKRVLYSKYEQDQFYIRQITPKHNHVYFHHKKYHHITPPSHAEVHTYHFYENKIVIKAHLDIYTESAHKVIAHIEMSYILDQVYFSYISDILNMNISLSNEKKYNSSALPLLGLKTNNTLNLMQTKYSYIGAASLNTLDANVFLIATLKKGLLTAKLNENRNKLFILLLLVTVLIVFILRFIFSRDLAIPLKALMMQIHKIEHRDYSISVKLKTGDEIESISKSINNLSLAVRSRESSLQESQKNLEYLSNHDALTNLPNRRLFNIRLEHAINLAKRNQTKLAVLFLDLDEFKQVNDSLGHDLGDELLQVVSKRLSDSLRNSDTIARIGGDEFHILIENIISVSEINNIVQKILDEFKALFLCCDHEISITTSIGVAIYPYDGLDNNSLIKNSDLAMYQSKKKGRNNFSYFSKNLSEQLNEQIEKTSALKTAIETFDEFFLLYQPKISAKTGKIVAVEALIRWNSSKLGFIRPDQFIALAEQTNLIVPLGEWILKQACSDFVTLQKKGCILDHISINISNKQLINSDLLHFLQQTIKTTGIEAHQVELEITESYIVSDEKNALQTLQDFRAMNVNLAIDDFGTGYSSLSYLQKLPVTRLKIDKSFVDNLPESDENIAIVNAIIVLAKAFNLAITAEGVETEAQLAFLKNAQCDEIQGYFYAKPLSITELEQFYSDNPG